MDKPFSGVARQISGQMSAFPGLTPGVLPALLWCILLSALLAVHVADYRALSRVNEYADPSGNFLLQEIDGYYFLRLAQELGSGEYAGFDNLRLSDRPSPAPPLSLITYLLAALSGTDLAGVAFFLPPILSTAVLALLWFCGRLNHSPWLGLLAAAAASTTHYLYSRTCLGFFDTDCLNPVFMLLAPLCLYLFTLRRGPGGFAWLAAFAAAVGLFFWWWPQGGTVAMGLSLLAYALSFPVPSPRWERVLKFALLAAMTTAIALLGLEFFDRMHTGIPAFETIVAHVRLILAGGETAAVGSSVQELAPQLPSSVFLDLAPFPGAVLLAEVGLVALIVIRRRFALFLLPLFVYAAASVFSQRFMIFTAPLYGLGYGYFYVLATERAPWVRGRPWARAGILAAMALLLVPSYVRNYEWHSSPSLTSREIPLANAVARETSPETVIWAWWDYGYFLQYMTGRRTLCDGGMASEHLVRALAVPLVVGAPEWACRWMRFEAGWPGGLFMLGEKLGGRDKAVAFLDQVFRAPGQAKVLASAAGLEQDRDWASILFPNYEVVLYLNRHTIDLAYWWYTFGTDTLRGPGHVPAELVDRRPLAEFEVDYAAGLFTRRLDRAGLRVAEVVDVRRVGVARYPGDPAARAAAVVYRDEGLVYFVARELMDTLAFRLLYAPLGEAAPGFTPLYRDPAAGGVWRADLR